MELTTCIECDKPSKQFICDDCRASEAKDLANCKNISEVIVVQDKLSAKRVTKLLDKTKKPPEELYMMVGSYARFDWVVRHCSQEFIQENLLALWSEADSDDQNLDYLDLFRRQVDINTRDLPEKRSYRIYRGQRKGEMGFSWTMDRNVAVKFSLTGGTRNNIPDGEVLELTVDREHILAYITNRGESEVILDITHPQVENKIRRKYGKV